MTAVSLDDIAPGDFIRFHGATACLEIVSVATNASKDGKVVTITARDVVDGRHHQISQDRWEQDPPETVDLKRVRDWHDPDQIERLGKTLGAPVDTIGRTDLEAIICRLLSGGAL